METVEQFVKLLDNWQSCTIRRTVRQFKKLQSDSEAAGQFEEQFKSCKTVCRAARQFAGQFGSYRAIRRTVGQFAGQLGRCRAIRRVAVKQFVKQFRSFLEGIFEGKAVLDC